MSELEFLFGNLKVKDGKELSEYTNRLLSETEDVIRYTIPQKIFLLQKLEKDELSPYEDISSISKGIELPREAYNVFPYKTDDSTLDPMLNAHGKDDSKSKDLPKTVSCNPNLRRLINLVKPEIKDLVGICEKIKTWIALLIPRIEDGNNFGVSIQEDIRKEVDNIKTKTNSYLNTMTWYFRYRGKDVSKVCKYPYVDDYRRSVEECDEWNFIQLQSIVSEMRSHYLIMLNLISNNYDKLKQPRSSNNTDSMY